MKNNKILVAAAGVLFAGSAVFGPMAEAMITLERHKVEMPEYAVGISEDYWYEKIVSSQTDGDIPCPTVNGNTACDISTGLFDMHSNIIARVEDKGQMYTWHYIDNNYYDGFKLFRYLPDGIYKTKKKVYLVQDGVRFRLKKGSAYEKTLAVARAGYAESVNQNMIDLLSQDKGDVCERMGYEQVLGTSTDECTEAINGAFDRYEGNLLINVDEDGAVYYIPQGGAAVKVEKKNVSDDMGWFKFMKSIAGKQKKNDVFNGKDQLHTVPSYQFLEEQKLY